MVSEGKDEEDVMRKLTRCGLCALHALLLRLNWCVNFHKNILRAMNWSYREASDGVKHTMHHSTECS